MRELIDKLPALQPPSGAGDQGGSLSERIRSLPPLTSGTAQQEVPQDRPAAPEPTPARNEADLQREEYANMPWSEVGSRALSNALPSAGRAVKGAYDAVVNYEDTASALNEVGKGVVSKVRGAFGGERNTDAEAVADAMGHAIADKYTSMGAFKQALAEDPASIGLDVASVAPFVGAAGRAAGLGKVATGLEKVASLGDPINAAAQGVKMASKVVTKPVTVASRIAQGTASGVPQSMLKLAEEAGRSGSPAQRAAFMTFAMGKGENRDIAKHAMDAIEELRRKTNAEYAARRSGLSTQELPMGEIKNAINRVEANLGGNAQVLFPQVYAALQDMKNRVSLIENSPNAADRSAIGLDLLKRSLADVAESMKDSGHYGALSEIPRATRNTIAAYDSTYADMMDRWQTWRNELLDFQRTLGTSDKAAESARLAKLLSTAKNEDKMSLLKQLAAQTEAGQLLPYMIAGATVEHLPPRYLQGMGIAGLGVMAAGGPHGIAAATLASPRLAGLASYGMGRLEGAINAVPTPPSAVTNLLSQIGQREASGGRVERKAGGRVGVNHDKMAEQLVGAAERAKKGISKGTESLLDMPDDHIAQALEVANRSI